MTYLILFSLSSRMGWILEVMYRFWKHKKVMNPGFLWGPYLPVYGFGGTMVFFLSERMAEIPIWGRFLVYATATTILELVIGLLVEKLYNKNLWDYSSLKWQYGGVISLRFTFYWGVF